jgi:hypothetical protein
MYSEQILSASSTDGTFGQALIGESNSGREGFFGLAHSKKDPSWSDRSGRTSLPLSNGVVHAVALLYSGRIEANLHHPELARNSLDLAQAILEQFAKRSPKHRYVLDALAEAKSALKALPDDTASIAVH